MDDGVSARVGNVGVSGGTGKLRRADNSTEELLEKSWRYDQLPQLPADPKHQLLYRMIRECLISNETHSRAEDWTGDDGPQFCERTFDGFACWDRTPAGAVASRRCPDIVVGFDPRRSVFKKCEENGTWSMFQNHPWTNYSTCVDVEDLYFRKIVTAVYVSGYTVSAAALLVSMLIFLYFKSLSCLRVKVHMHLFTATLVSDVLWVVWLLAVVTDVDTLRESPIWCQVFNLVLNYFTVSTYMWMFVEGLHLYFSLTVVFVREKVAMLWFVAIGWTTPLVLVAAYAAVRSTRHSATDRCWMDNDDTFWIISGPVLLSLIGSFLSLLKVVRILVTKLPPNGSRQRVSMQLRRAARATCILVPLFGLHYIIIPFRPADGDTGEAVYQVVSALITSLQGLCVAVLFCFTNQEVQAAMRAHLSRMFPSSENIPMTGTIAGDSLVNTRDNTH